MAQENPTLHDQIAKLCLEKFDSLPKSRKPNDNEWTILSCIVQEREKLEVIALGTGTKCIGHDKMSEDGDILNDSHAEIICRRAFLLHIYNNMLCQPENSFLNYNTEKQKFSIKYNIKFHFFTTHVPCGDAAIFGKETTEHFGDIICTEDFCEDVEPKRRKLDTDDIHRTGAKCLETDKKQDLKLPGTEYHITGVVRTKPGRGIQTLSVSCSDKIAKWCHLGVQGALLSILLDKPVYFSSFIIVGGTPYNEEALLRAFYNRLGKVSLKEPYHQNKMILNQTNLNFAFGKSKEKSPCPSSIIWTNKHVEVAVDGRRQGVTKKQIKTRGILRISKKELFKNFLQVVQKYDIRINDIDNLSYKSVKLLSESYQESWNILKSKNFKVWTVKNDDLLNFIYK